jgi:tRNA(Ile)-lysidine synthase
MEAFLDKLRAGLSRMPVSIEEGHFVVAFSGGLDSTTLLAGLCRLIPPARLRAVHVDHALQPESAGWERHCAAAAASLGVRYVSERVAIDVGAGDSIEALARRARYRVFAQLLRPAEVLVTAHHGDDQLETMLLRLLRGSGVSGLRGIVEFAPFAGGYLARPMLDLSRAEIRAQAEQWGLRWIEDPANREQRFDRNYLRSEVIPALKRRWPAAERSMVRAARHMADAEEILEAMAEADARALPAPGCVPRSAITRLDPPRQRNLLRHLVRRCGLPVPDSRQLEELRAALHVERADARTRVQWPGGEARVFRDRLYLLEPLRPAGDASPAGRLKPGAEWRGPAGRVVLELGEGTKGLPDSWVAEGLEIRFRSGGERFRPRRGGPSRRLKRWLQETGIVPWMRDRIPLLYHRGTLVAIGDLWLAEAPADLAGERRWLVRWGRHPPLH